MKGSEKNKEWYLELTFNISFLLLLLFAHELEWGWFNGMFEAGRFN